MGHKLNQRAFKVNLAIDRVANETESLQDDRHEVAPR